MAIEIGSRLLAVIAAVAFTLVFTTGRLPVIPKGRWTVVALFTLGLAMCTVAGTRDGLGTTLAHPAWLTISLTISLTTLGISAFAVLVAVLIGFNWRIGTALLGVAIAASWLLALAYAVYAGLDTAPFGLVTLAVAAGAGFAAWRLPEGRVGRQIQAPS
jgi:hypothetical protein